MDIMDELGWEKESPPGWDKFGEVAESYYSSCLGYGLRVDRFVEEGKWAYTIFDDDYPIVENESASSWGDALEKISDWLSRRRGGNKP